MTLKSLEGDENAFPVKKKQKKKKRIAERTVSAKIMTTGG